MSEKTLYIACINDGQISAHDTEEEAREASLAEGWRILEGSGRLHRAKARGQKIKTPADCGIYCRVVDVPYFSEDS